MCSSYSQKLTKDISLSKKIDETSGLEIIDGQFITHNDSGGDPKLYYLDKKGKIVFERTLDGVKNNDWEDITKMINSFMLLTWETILILVKIYQL